MLGASVALADAPPLVLEHLTTADGLPQATVMTTLQDSQGFVWLGTEDGLVRFDGHELYRYARSRTQPGSLPGNYVWQIVEDANADLWIATNDAGVAKWSRRSDTFTSYRHAADNSDSLASDRVRTVLVDSRGHIWIGTFDAGVDVLDPSSGRIEHLRNDPNDSGSLGSDHVSTLALDRAGDVWIGTDKGLNRWRSDTRTLVRVGPPPGDAHSLRDTKISAVIEDRTGALWIGGAINAGLVRMDRDGRILETFRHDAKNPATLGSDDVRAILEDESGNLWVGTADGLALFDRSTRAFSHYRHDGNDGESLRDSFVMSLYQDRAGLVWVGTRTGGVSRWNPRSWELGGRRPAWLENQPVTAFADAPDNKVWIASLAAGLVRFDAATGVATPLGKLIGRDNPIGDAPVTSLRLDKRGNLWIGTMGRGLTMLAPDGRIESIPVRAGDSHALAVDGVLSLLESRSGEIWIGTYNGGVNVLDPATRTVRQLPYGSAPGEVSAPNVTALVEDTHGNLWLGTEGGGLDLARADGTVLKVFRNDPANPATLPANSVYALAVDGDGRVWVATDGGGLARVVDSGAAPDAIEFQVLSRADGLSSDTLWGIVPDARGRLWLSGNSGLMRFDPATRAIKTYHREHGLQGEEFSFGAAFRLRDGRVAFGGAGGFNIFDPVTLSENAQPPRVALTSVEVLGVRAQTGDTPFWLRDRVSLDYRGTIVSLDFGVLDYTSPTHNRLAYRMAGLTDDWIDLGAQRRVTLTNLDAGDHVLEVRAANSDSVWSDKPLKLTIHRDPAPWASPAAYAVYALLVLAFVGQRIRAHRRKMREMVEASERLEAEVQLRTRELRESNRQLEEAARAKNDFLDRMSHELRTPMNGVVGMTELLTRTTLSATQSHLTKTIRSSAQILLQIVNDLLDLSKIRAGKVALEKLPIDLGQVLEECTTMFAGVADNKGIELIVCPPEPARRVLLGDPLRVRQVLMNLVGNAVKFTERGEVVVRADIETLAGDRATVRLSVADTGIGMDAAALNKIFEPFAQADETTTRRFGGTGLGLAICRELADLMGGRITVESRPGVGSTFQLSLPLALGDAIAPRDPPLPQRTVRIFSRRPSLAESIARHAAEFGLTALPADSEDAAADVVVVDATTRPSTLASVLASGPRQPPLVVIATSADVESRALRLLVPDKQIVLKPVHSTALQEAFAAALGEAIATEHAEPARAAPSAPLKAHVLLVEDEAVNAAVAQGYLEALGCTSTWVENGAEAVACAAAERFDIVFMDLSMPGMDGFATTALIRQQESRAAHAHGPKARTPIVALTAHDAARYRERCLAADIDDILSKPYTLDDCRRVLRQWVARAHEAQPAHAAIAPDAATLAPAALASVDANAVAALRRLNAGKQGDLYSKLVELFRTSSTQSLAQLNTAFDADDLPAVAAVCHKLASAAANVGALAFAQAVKELERHALAAEREPALELQEALCTAHLPLLEALQGQRLRASA